MASNTTLFFIVIFAMAVLISYIGEARELAKISHISLITASAVGRTHGGRIRETCNNSMIQISQAQTAPSNGIPTYTVEIANTCVSGCIVSHIHVACGMFSSANLINPKVFRRLKYNDCLVNDGKPIPSGRVISFKYSTTYSYPLQVSSLICH